VQDSKRVELVQADLVTYLAQIADDLRVDSLALSGVAHQGGDALDPETRAVLALGASLERKAYCLAAAAQVLCGKCRLLPVNETLALKILQTMSRSPRPIARPRPKGRKRVPARQTTRREVA